MNDASRRGTPPADYEALRVRLAREHERLSPRLRQIAEFALAHPDEVALETVAGLAARIGVPPSALVRFAQAFGYSGFSALQRIFRERLVARLPAYAQRIRRARREAGRLQPALAAFLEAAQQACARLPVSELQERLAAAAGLLASRPRLAVVGMRRSFPVAAYLAYAFARLGRDARLLAGPGGTLALEYPCLDAERALLAVSFSPYAPETLETIGVARRAGAPVVALTDGPLSPLVREADVALVVADPEVEGVRGLAASMTVASALVLELGRRLVETDGEAGADAAGSHGDRT